MATYITSVSTLPSGLCHSASIAPCHPVPGLEDTMNQAVHETFATASKLGCSYRLAAFVNALQKIAATYRDAGFSI
jgi:hypothetical protein